MTKNYIFPRNFFLWGQIGFCAGNIQSVTEDIISLPTSSSSATIGFMGVPAAIACMEDEVTKKIYEDLTYVSIDGMPIVKKCKKLGIECERCAGPDVMLNILKKSVSRGETHYFYGGKNDDVLNNIKKNLETQFPGINIVGMYSPPFRDLTEEEDNQIIKEINKLHPDYVWVGIGQPRQDYWLKQHKFSLKNTKILGVGAAFDFMAGSLDRAPKIVQNVGLEWLYRFFKEPGRLWNRYIVGGFKFILLNLKYKDSKI